MERTYPVFDEAEGHMARKSIIVFGVVNTKTLFDRQVSISPWRPGKARSWQMRACVSLGFLSPLISFVDLAFIESASVDSASVGLDDGRYDMMVVDVSSRTKLYIMSRSSGGRIARVPYWAWRWGFGDIDVDGWLGSAAVLLGPEDGLRWKFWALVSSCDG